MQHTSNSGVLSPSKFPEEQLYQEEPEDVMTNKELCEAKNVSKCVRILTVLAYILSVSMAAILLSLYYVFLWDPTPSTPSDDPEPPNALRASNYNTFYPPMMMFKINESARHGPGVEETTTTFPFQLNNVLLDNNTTDEETSTAFIMNETEHSTVSVKNTKMLDILLKMSNDANHDKFKNR